MTWSKCRTVSGGMLLGALAVILMAVGCEDRESVVLDVPGRSAGDLVRPAAAPLDITVVDSNGDPVNGFRWLLEEDTTYPVEPGIPVADSISVRIHKSYSPVMAKGVSITSTTTVNVPDNTRSVLSVLPVEPGYALSGANIAVGQTDVTVVCHNLPLPTAQISVYVFHDNKPLNNAPDIPAEQGLEGFNVVLHDTAGQQMLDVFGNMLGTTYVKNPDGSFPLDADGNPFVDVHGTGVTKTNANGEALIKYLGPGKYGIQVVPPQGENWVQTSTIEGTPVVDAWVRAGEPPYFAEWGFFQWHAFFGFVKPTVLPPPSSTVGNITGQVVYVHQNRPPLSPGLEPGPPVEDAWVGLNDLNAADEMIYAQPCEADGYFSISDVPPGMYQLVMWDLALDAIIDFRTVRVPPDGATVEMGQVPVYAWFGNLEGSVFHDTNMNGFRDPGEIGIRDQAVVLRFTDGSIYQETATDPMGDYSLNEVFPFFHWLVAEVDFARYKATGATFIVDEGGQLAPGMKNTPQLQPDNGDLPWRTETGEVLTQGMMLFAGSTNEIHWGKAPYEGAENGGISGIVFYGTTRAEDDPRFAGAEPWEPGIPRVQVALYSDSDCDRMIDDLDGDSGPTLADVDNYPFDWFEGGAKGSEDLDRNGNGAFDPGDAISITWTDSWDDNQPTGAVGPTLSVNGQPIQDGAESIRTWNQLRPGVFDGGYAFSSYFPGGIVSGSPEADGIPPGQYIVEASPPPGYEIVKEEDKNVDFGEQYIPVDPAAVKPELGPPLCVGDIRTVPDELSLFPGIPAPFAGQDRPLADRKLVVLSGGLNAACDFFFFTEVPKAARIWGMVLNDVALEFDPDSPRKGSNLGVAWIPVSIKDWAGVEVARVYTDEWGGYNALVPSTYTNNLGAPSGMSPNILVAHLNDPGPIPDPGNPGQLIIDPFYNPRYGQTSTQWQFFPGKTTRLDTPILPIGAFSKSKNILECSFPDGTPIISSVTGVASGPYVSAPGTEITITSLGTTVVANPDYDPLNPGAEPTTVIRDFGFGGTMGSVTVGASSLLVADWFADGSTIVCTVPAGVQTGQLMITRGDEPQSSLIGVTLHVAGPDIPAVVPVSEGESIQAAIDSAADNSLILLGPGVYWQNPIVWKPVKIQGSGAYSTILQAGPVSPTEMNAWEAKLQALIDAGSIELIPGERPDFFLETGTGILVSFAQATTVDSLNPPLIDGLTIQGAIRGGGIFANAYAKYLHISNNKIVGNQGNFGGGIRIGTPSLVNASGTGYNSSYNTGLNIHHNHITTNGAVDGGGGIAIFNGADDYIITDNYICGNFTLLYGGGIAHFGLSSNGLIADNTILFNESFDEGAGIMVAGELVFAGAPAGTLTEGSGSVQIARNLIKGNLSGDDGGGIRVLSANGQDVSADSQDPTQWHRIDIVGNYIVNNVSADAGGGISLDDAARVYIVNNTVAHNDSTATGVDAFGGPLQENNPPGAFLPAEQEGIGGLITSVPQVAGIQARAHSLGLQGAFGEGYEQEFSNPVLHDNIIWRNRAFYWDASYNNGLGGIRPDVGGGETARYWDLAVTGTLGIELMDPKNCVLTSVGYNLPDGTPGQYDVSNVSGDPIFVDPYVNVFDATSKGAAFGNFVNITFTPLKLVGDYHIEPGSAAIDLGAGIYLGEYPLLSADSDGDTRTAPNVDAGADELP